MTAEFSMTQTLTRLMPTLSRSLMRAVTAVGVWQDRRRTRAGLKRLDAHLIRDIGLDPLTAMAEAGKPFWRD